MKITLAVAVTLLLTACGGAHQAATTKFVAASVPVYPGARAPKVVVNATYQTTDFTLAAGTKPSAVYGWYAVNLPTRGWSITQRNESGLHAEKGQRTLDVGVRGRTLEVNQG